MASISGHSAKTSAGASHQNARHIPRSPNAPDPNNVPLPDNYPVPPKRPAIEIGKLIDDVSVSAIVIEDILEAVDKTAPPSNPEREAAECLAGARKLAAHVKGTPGQQTEFSVMIGNVRYGCPLGPKGRADVTIA